MYAAFAGVYDALMEQVDYKAWAAHYDQLMQLCRVKKGARCVECACGTGSITLPLRKMGYQMTGVDVSEEMIQKAMERARNEGLMIPFIRQDMCQLQLPRKTECILATCDGVNYLAEPEKVKQFFRAAFDGLKSGGALIFDVSSEYKLKNTLGNNTLTCDEEDVAYIWHNRFNEKTACVDMALSIFRKRADGAFDRIEEQQTQRAHTKEELCQWLAEAGFEQVKVFGNLRMTAPRSNDERLHFCAVKP